MTEVERERIFWRATPIEELSHDELLEALRETFMALELSRCRFHELADLKR